MFSQAVQSCTLPLPKQKLPPASSPPWKRRGSCAPTVHSSVETSGESARHRPCVRPATRGPVRVAVDHLNGAPAQAATRAMCNNLKILPTRLRLFAGVWAPHSRIGWHWPPGFDQRLSIVALPIGRAGRRRIWMSPAFELGHQLPRHFPFVLAQRSPNAQSSIHIYCGTTPEGATMSTRWEIG
jgi:hypothetical protein